MFTQKSLIELEIQNCEEALEYFIGDGRHRHKDEWGYDNDPTGELIWFEWRYRFLRDILNAWNIIEQKQLGELHRNAIKVPITFLRGYMIMRDEDIMNAASVAILIN